MSVQVLLDGVDITAELNKQHPVPQTLGVGVFPDDSHEKWWDLWAVIKSLAEFKNEFQTKAVHTLKLVDSDGTAYDAKLLMKTKYTARNR